MQDAVTSSPPGGEGEFAEGLSAAIRARGLSLDRLVSRLSVMGTPLSAATLSYWSSGTRRPERRDSLAALASLELVLGVAPGHLSGRLPVRRPRGRGSVPRTVAAGMDVVPHWPAAERVFVELGHSWDDRLRIVSVHDLLRVGPDRRSGRQQVRLVVRSLRDGERFLPVFHAKDTPGGRTPVVTARRGCTLAAVVSDPSQTFVGVKLDLGPVVAGETVLVEYDVDLDEPDITTHGRRELFATKEILLKVHFADGHLPRRIERVEEQEGRPAAVRPVAPAEEVVLHRTDAPAGLTGLEWEW